MRVLIETVFTGIAVALATLAACGVLTLVKIALEKI